MFKQPEGLQHPRTAGAGGTSGLVQLPCSGQGLLQEVAQGCPARFCYRQGWKCHNLSGQLLPVFDHTYSQKAYCSLHWNRISVFQSVPIAYCPVTRHHQEKLGSIFFTPPPGIYIQWQVPSGPASSGWAVTAPTAFPYIKDLQSLNHLQALWWTCFIKFMSLLYLGAQHWAQHPRCHQGSAEEKDHLSHPLCTPPGPLTSTSARKAKAWAPTWDLLGREGLHLPTWLLSLPLSQELWVNTPTILKCISMFPGWEGRGRSFSLTPHCRAGKLHVWDENSMCT